MTSFARNTLVPIHRSRAEVDRLLRDWGATGVQWSDDYTKGIVHLRFVIAFDGRQFMARFSLALQSQSELEEHAKDGRSGRVSQNKLSRLLNERGKQEHRVLLLWLKAAVNAVEAGIVTPQTLFLPFLEDDKGNTFAERALPVLAKLASGGNLLALTEGNHA